jgi:hypothetical protein
MTDSKVFVYRNLRFKDQVIWSMKNVKSGKVVGREPLILLENVKLKVSKAGQERVRREKKKYVHAGVEGTPAPIDLGTWADNWIKVYYNPYKTDTFIRVDNGEPVFEASKAYINQEGVFITL